MSDELSERMQKQLRVADTVTLDLVDSKLCGADLQCQGLYKDISRKYASIIASSMIL
jgi:hypothetical protein